ncbi:MAG: pilus assembly protein N-terminal domain-containing protein [Gammaproteobacteria bacterium]|nr:pilus assembly protein N-terminal domain-containing protein [Gammaproteobacteria bacterium]
MSDLALSLAEDSNVSGQIIATDPDGGTLTYSSLTQPAHGELSVDAVSGSIVYVPDADYFGSDMASVSATSGGKRAVAMVTFAITNVPDAPRITSISDQQNNAYALETSVPLHIVDVDGDPVTVTAAVGDTAIAAATVVADSTSLMVTPLARGSTTVTVTASDGALETATTFQFSIGDVTKAVTVEAGDSSSSKAAAEAAPTPTGEVVSISNVSTRDVDFELTYNEHTPFASIGDVVAHVRNMPSRHENESFPHKLWRFVRDNTYHGALMNYQLWWYDFWPMLNSLGFGQCSEAAALFVEIARAAGYEARVWTLIGHVVPEVYEDGAWRLYDPDVAVYYYTRTHTIAGVQELAEDPTLISNPTDPIYGSSNSSAYSTYIADIYDSKANNNAIARAIAPPLAPAGTSLIRLPAGSRLLLPGHWTAAPIVYDGLTPYTAPAYRQAAIELPAQWTGDVKLPWVLHDVQGSGSIFIDGMDFAVGSAELRAFLAAPGRPLTTASVASNVAGIRLVFMINATWYDYLKVNSVEATGQDVWALEISKSAVDAAVQVEPFPADLRRPDI